MIKNDTIALADLIVNTENYRYDPLSSQKEAIDIMIEDQKDKLYNLAEHIITNGLNPNDKIQVVPSEHDRLKFIVLEGNRRVISLKIINNPNIIDHPEYLYLKKKFKKLHDENRSRLLNEIECIVYDDPSEADKWIKIKHTGQINGIGTVDWNPQQIQRFDEKVEGKSSIALQTINLLKQSDDVPDDVKKNINNIPITNLDRLISDPNVRDFLGFEINNGILQSEIDQREVIKGLVQIAKDLLNPDFKVKKIYTKDDRKDYIKNFPKENIPDLKNRSQKPWQFTDIKGLSGKKPSGQDKKSQKERIHLIPKSCALNIKNPKVNSIYHELQKIDINKFTNAVAVTFRVFVELSFDCYIESNKPNGANIDTKLLGKVSAVAKHLEDNGFADKHICKGIKNATNNKNDLLGIDTWHAYVHNPHFSPTSQNLIVTWDNMQVFIEKVWENIK